MPEETMSKEEIADALESLSRSMLLIGTAMEFFGGFAPWAQHGKEMVRAAAIATEWVKEIREEGA